MSVLAHLDFNAQVPLELLTNFLDAAQSRKWHKANTLAKQVFSPPSPAAFTRCIYFQVLDKEPTNKLVNDYMPHIHSALEHRRRMGMDSDDDDETTDDSDDDSNSDSDEEDEQEEEEDEEA